MELIDVLNELDLRGIHVESREGKLKLKAPEGAMTSELLKHLKVHKAELIQLLETRRAVVAREQPPLDKSAPLPLSFAQERVWFLTQLDPASASAYNVVAAIRMRGSLKCSFLEHALNTVIARHEVLRTRFENANGNPVQLIEAASPIGIESVLLNDLQGNTATERLDGLISRESALAFDLSSLPLIRAKLIECSADESVFLLVMHHIVTDDWSSGILIREVAALYEAFSTGGSVSLPPLDFQFCDYVRWQADWIESSAYTEALDFWKPRLEGTPILNFGTDHPRTAEQSFAGASLFCHYPKALSEQLEDLAKASNVTLYSLLLTAFKVLLYRYTGQLDIAVGSPIANRKLKETEGLIGFFTNTVVYRSNLDGGASFMDVLRTLNEQVRDSQNYQDLPFEKLVEALNPERNVGVNPLFQVCFSLLHAYRDELQLGDLELTRLDHSSPTSRFDFTVMVEKTVDGLRVDVEYCTDLFKASTVQRFLEHYEVLLAGIVSNPYAQLRELPLATADERSQLLDEWNLTETNYPSALCVHELFEQFVGLAPDAIALVCDDQTMSYGELERCSNQLGHKLRELGVGPDVGVAVCARRSISMVISLLAVLKAGGYYLPFDEADPLGRLSSLFEETGVKAILAPKDVLSVLPDGLGERVDWDAVGDGLSGYSSDRLENLSMPESLAYVTFTSGSTGKPKGIMVPHRGVVRLVRNSNYLEYTSDLTILELAPVSFDASTFELWGALCNGAKMVIMPPEKPSIQSLSRHIEDHGITTMYLTSAMFNLMVEEKLDVLCQLKHLLVGGDVISVSHAQKLLAANSGIHLINGYGPTETTTFAACHTMVKPEDVGHTVSIGTAISNTQLYVLDAYFNVQPIGVPGDLYIGGDGNARGYFNRPDLTAECFVPNPFAKSPGDLMYRTGDLARFVEDGALEFLGRRDNQVKVRGFRIELGEIENNLRGHPQIKEVAVLAKDEGSGSKKLIAFYQLNDALAINHAELADFLAKQLPDYMIPSTFVPVDGFELNMHNKINRKALEALWSEESLCQEGDYVAPSNPVEEVLALVWAEVLKLERVSVDANFFQVGGHSLLATKIIWKLFEVFSIEIPLKHLFLSPTVKSLAAELLTQETVQGRCMRAAKIYLRLSRLSPEQVAQMLEKRQ